MYKRQLLVAPFCVRPRPAAPVSTPLRWEEVKAGLQITDFNIRSVPARMEQLGTDPLEGVFGDEIDLLGALEALGSEIGRLP